MTMMRWFLLLGGMLVWAIHFGGAYAIASVFDLLSDDDAPAALWATGGLTLLCLMANAVLLAVIASRFRRVPPDDVAGSWMLSGGALLAGLSFISVAWQGLPALFAR